MHEYKLILRPLLQPKHPSARAPPPKSSGFLGRQPLAQQYRPPLTRFPCPEKTNTPQRWKTAVRAAERGRGKLGPTLSLLEALEEQRGDLGGRGRKDEERRNCHLRIVSLWDDRKG